MIRVYTETPMCDHPDRGITYRDPTVTVWACPDCETEWEEVAESGA